MGLLTGVVSIVMSLRVDRMYDQRLTWTEKLQDKDSPEYLQLEYESSNAVSIFLQTIVDLLSLKHNLGNRYLYHDNPGCRGILFRERQQIT